MRQSGTVRIRGLDALRGLAALSVVGWHFLAVLPAIPIWLLPLKALWAGPQAVGVFFVLSGFVLSLLWWESRMTYWQFAGRRVLRIYPAYVVAIAIAVIILAILPLRSVGTIHLVAPTTGLVVQHALLLGNFNVDAYDPPIWSLVHEMRLSLLLPLLLILCRRSWVSVGAVWVGSAIAFYLLRRFIPDQVGWWDTLRVVPLFALGAVMCAERQRLAAWFESLSTLAQAALLAGAFIAYTASAFMKPSWFGTAAPCVGIFFFILAAITPGASQNFLHSPILQFLGAVSYGIYLVHAPVLWTFAHFIRWTPALWTVSLAVTLLLAYLLHRTVELPFIALGRRLRSTGERRPQAV